MELQLGPNRHDITTAAVIIGVAATPADVVTIVEERADGVLCLFDGIDEIASDGLPVGVIANTVDAALAAHRSGVEFVVVSEPGQLGEVVDALDESSVLVVDPSDAIAVDLTVDAARAADDADVALGRQVAAHRAGARIILTNQVQRSRRTMYTIDQLLQRQTQGVG